MKNIKLNKILIIVFLSLSTINLFASENIQGNGKVSIDSNTWELSDEYCEYNEESIEENSNLRTFRNINNIFNTDSMHSVKINIFSETKFDRVFNKAKLDFTWSSDSLVRAAGKEYIREIEKQILKQFSDSRLNQNDNAIINTRSPLLLCDFYRGDFTLSVKLKGYYHEIKKSKELFSNSELVNISTNLIKNKKLINSSLDLSATKMESIYGKKLMAGAMIGYEIKNSTNINLSDINLKNIKLLMASFFDVSTVLPIKLNHRQLSKLSEQLTDYTNERKNFTIILNNISGGN
jgi:hypothetical protein